MKELSRGTPWLGRTFHGFAATKPHFRGKILRQVFCTLHDTVAHTSTRAWLYLCERNVLLFAQHLAADGVLSEIEPTDPVRVRPISTEELAGTLGATSGTEQNLSVRTTGDVCVIEIGDRFALLPDIQVDGAYGEVRINFRTSYLTGEHYIRDATNLVDLIHAVQRGEIPRPTKHLPGLSPRLMRLNYVLMAVAVVVSLAIAALMALAGR